ncbi:MAG TPA: response regulator transcription factor [Novosphingobium sp.]|nr:response regulator transcription factor [Novosphingobium sp.]
MMLAPRDATAAAARILVAEDDADIRELIIAQLERETYEILPAASVAEVRAALAAAGTVGGRIDLIILDLNLPDGDGLDLCRALRADGYEGAIIMVTARDAAIDRVLGLELGADDYLTKPFEPRELLARVRNWLRRLGGPAGAQPRNARKAHIGPWQVDLYHRRLIAPDARLVMLSSAEFRLLQRFLDTPNQVLSREELLPERGATVAFDRSIDLQIHRLRQKLASEPGGDDLILTVRNEGYVLAGEVVFE